MEALLKFKATAVLVLVNCLVMIYYGNTQIPHFSLQEMGLMKLVQTAFYHMNRIHFTYNTASLICKGMRLEQQMGSAMFGFTALALTFLSHSLIAMIASISEYAYPAGNAQVGFSAVVLSLKVLVNELDDELHGGLKDVGWMEGFVVPFLFPDRTVIVGLFCGVLAGYIYIHVMELFVRCLNGNVPADIGFHDYSDNLSWVCPSCAVTNGVYFENCDNCSQSRIHNS
jgi:hypothetical protein